MSDSDSNPINDLLSSFALGPSWAKATGAPQSGAPKTGSNSGERSPRGGDRQRDDRRGGGRDFDRGGERRPFKGGGKSDARRMGPPRPQVVEPEEGVTVTLLPDANAVHLIGKEIHQVARVYPLFDVAKILLAERGRCRAVFEADASHAPLILAKSGDALFLNREDAVRHLWRPEIRATYLDEETIEVDPPTGNFQTVARCGISGEWLGPPNFHTYQANLRRLHRERFSSTPFAFYSSMVRTERGEEAVNAWLETMKSKTRWRIKGGDEEAWMDDKTEAERALAKHCFDAVFVETRKADVLASIAPDHLSPSLLESMKQAGNHARNFPALLIPAVCRAVEAEHLPVFKRKGKLFTGPSRPHPLSPNDVLAERPGIMVAWIRENSPAKLEGLWKAVLPEGGSAPSADFAADLFWLLQRGHVLLFTDDTLVVPEIKENAPPAPESGEAKTGKKKKKKKSKKNQTPGDATAAEPVETATPTEDSAADGSSGALEGDVDAGPAPTPAESDDIAGSAPAVDELPAVTESTETADPVPATHDAKTPPVEEETASGDENSKNLATGVDESSPL